MNRAGAPCAPPERGLADTKPRRVGLRPIWSASRSLPAPPSFTAPFALGEWTAAGKLHALSAHCPQTRVGGPRYMAEGCAHVGRMRTAPPPPDASPHPGRAGAKPVGWASDPPGIRVARGLCLDSSWLLSPPADEPPVESSVRRVRTSHNRGSAGGASRGTGRVTASDGNTNSRSAS